MGGLRKSMMHSDSRKARPNSFAHHRAKLLFSSHLTEAGIPTNWSPTVHEGTEVARDLRDRVSAGILGFVRAAQPAVAS